MGRQAIDDQMDAFGEGMVMLRLLPGQRVVLVGERAGRVDQHSRPYLERRTIDHIAGLGDPKALFVPCAPERLDVVRRGAAAVHRRANEAEYELGVVVVEVSVRVLEAADPLVDCDDRFLASHLLFGEKPGWPGEAVPEKPVEPGTRIQFQPTVAKTLRYGGKEPNFLDDRRKASDQMIAR